MLSHREKGKTMAVFRVEKTKDFTLMSNHHLKNKNLTLKAKGLLSLMLSLPDTWDYTLKGLAAICYEGVDAIRTAVKELEKEGYIVRRQIRSEKGQIKDVEYTIYERPCQMEPEWENPILEKPMADKPTLEEPMTENPIQLSTKESKTNKRKDPSINLSESDIEEVHTETIRKQIDYDRLIQKYNKLGIQELVDLIDEVREICRHNTEVRIGEHRFPSGFVLKRFQALRYEHICYVMDQLKQTSKKISNIKAYLVAVLFNAPGTISQYYDSEVRHDFK